MLQINPYLTFNGDCEAAFTHYRATFGGEFQRFSRFNEIPPSEEFPLTDDEMNHIMHVALPVGDAFVLMGSDSPAAGGALVKGNNFSISVSAGSEVDVDRIFAALSDGGEVTMPVAQTFWNSYFGMCVDRFGIQWMVGYDYEE